MDIIEDGVTFPVDAKGMIMDRKMYKKHHKVRGILVEALPHSEYTEIVNKFTTKAIFESLCCTYEGNKHVKEAKTNQLMHQYEIFRMKEHEDIKTMYSRFKTLGVGLQVLNKSYIVLNHVKKIIKSFPTRLRPKVTAVQEANDLNKISLKNLISSIKSHEIELIGDEPAKKSKSIALKSRGKSSKSLQDVESKEETPNGGSDDDLDVEEMTYLTKRIH